MLKLSQGATLVAATMTMGLMAGVFGLYAHTIMPGLGRTDDRTFGGRSVLPWAVAALVLYLAAFVVTLGVNVPLNDGIKAAGDPDRIADLAAVRERFNEARWVRWNIARAVASTAALGCLTWALVQYGRTLLSGGA